MLLDWVALGNGTMEDGTLVPLLVGAVALATAIVTLATVLVTSRRLRREVTQVHVVVNSKHTEALDRVDQLAAALEDAGVAIPRKPSDPRPPASGSPNRRVEE